MVSPLFTRTAEQKFSGRNRHEPIGCDFCGAKYDGVRKFVAGLVKYTCEKCIDPAFRGSLGRFGPEASPMTFVCAACEFQNDGKRRFVEEKVSFICEECVGRATILLASTP